LAESLLFSTPRKGGIALVRNGGMLHTLLDGCHGHRDRIKTSATRAPAGSDAQFQSLGLNLQE
jgi:hypothetical protein